MAKINAIASANTNKRSASLSVMSIMFAARVLSTLAGQPTKQLTTVPAPTMGNLVL